MNGNTIKAPVRLGCFVVSVCALLFQTAWAQGGPTRIVVLPFYAEAGTWVTDRGVEGSHIRRISRLINNHLRRHGLEAMSPSAIELTEQDYSVILERPGADSPLAARNLPARYSVDVVYLVWLDVTTDPLDGDYCEAEAFVEGEGYDSAGRAIGAGVARTFTATARGRCTAAIREVEKHAGKAIGRLLTTGAGPDDPQQVACGGAAAGGGSVVTNRVRALENLLNVRLEGATNNQVFEVFGKVINIVRGVTEAKLYRHSLRRGHPQASFAIWRVCLDGTEPFRLMANVMRMFKAIHDAGGKIVINGVNFDFEPWEIDLLRGIHPVEAGPGSVLFVIDYDRQQDFDFASG